MKRILLAYCIPAAVCFILTFLLSSVRFPYGISPFYGGAYLTMLSVGGNYFALSAAYLLARFASLKSKLALLQGALLLIGAGLPGMVSLIRRRKIHPFYTVISAFFAEIPTMFFLPASEWLIFLANAAFSCLFSFLLSPPMAKLKKGALLFGEWELFVTSVACFALGAGSFGVHYFGLVPIICCSPFFCPFHR